MAGIKLVLSYIRTMNMKKLLPILLLIIMAVAVIGIRRCNSSKATAKKTTTQRQNPAGGTNNTSSANDTVRSRGFARNPDKLFFTKHAKCRMKCRQITQAEVKAILVDGNINYNKSELNEERGPKYAIEGITNDGQHVRIIFAPNTQHISVLTVIDLEEDYTCNCD